MSTLSCTQQHPFYPSPLTFTLHTMSEESVAQRSARLRRERREAKIKEGGSARLDKITSLSGRTTQSGKSFQYKVSQMRGSCLLKPRKLTKVNRARRRIPLTPTSRSAIPASRLTRPAARHGIPGSHPCPTRSLLLNAPSICTRPEPGITPGSPSSKFHSSATRHVPCDA